MDVSIEIVSGEVELGPYHRIHQTARRWSRGGPSASQPRSDRSGLRTMGRLAWMLRLLVVGCKQLHYNYYNIIKPVRVFCAGWQEGRGKKEGGQDRIIMMMYKIKCKRVNKQCVRDRIRVFWMILLVSRPSIRIELLPSLDGDHPDGLLEYWTSGPVVRRTTSCSNAIVIGDAVQWPTTRPTRAGWDRRLKLVSFPLFARRTSAGDSCLWTHKFLLPKKCPRIISISPSLPVDL